MGPKIEVDAKLIDLIDYDCMQKLLPSIVGLQRLNIYIWLIILLNTI